MKFTILRWLFIVSFLFTAGFFIDAGFQKSEIYKSAVIFSREDELREMDLIILGGSNGLVSYDQKYLEKLLGLKIYNLSEDDTNLELHLVQLKMLLEKQIKPKVLILNIGSQSRSLSRNHLRYLPLLGKSDSLDVFLKRKDYYYYFLYRYFPILKYGKYNNDLLYPIIYNCLLNNTYRHRFDINGEYTYPNSVGDFEDGTKVINEVRKSIKLSEFEEICKREKINLLIVNTPYYNQEVRWTDRCDLLLNYSTFLFGKRNCFYDDLHVNKKGKKLFTRKFAEDFNKVKMNFKFKI